MEERFYHRLNWLHAPRNTKEALLTITENMAPIARAYFGKIVKYHILDEIMEELVNDGIECNGEKTELPLLRFIKRVPVGGHNDNTIEPRVAVRRGMPQ